MTKSLRFIVVAAVVIIFALIVSNLRKSAVTPNGEVPAPPITAPSAPVTTKPGGTTSPTPKPTTPTSTPKANAMSVALHQQPGKTLVVESVTLLSPGFIIVQDASADRDAVVPTKIIATSALIKAGTTKNVVINVTTSPGAKYFLTLRTDNSNKVFIPQEDPVTRDAADKPISVMVTTDAPSASGSQTHYVTMKDLAFSPKTLTVQKGDTVFFRNTDVFPHTVTATAFGGSHPITAGGSYILNTANLARGTYSYRCDYHSPMTASITIE